MSFVKHCCIKPRPVWQLSASLGVALVTMLGACTHVASTQGAASNDAPSSSADAAKPVAASTAANGVASVEAIEGSAWFSNLPADPEVQRRFDQARQALLANQVAEAEQGFTALAQSHPQLPGPYANLGLIYRRAQRLDESVAALERAVELNPQQSQLQQQLGISYRMAGQFEKARLAYERAITLEPKAAEPYLNLGILHDLYLNDAPRALQLYQQYLSLSGQQKQNNQDNEVVRKWVAELQNRLNKSNGSHSPATGNATASKEQP